MSTTIRRSTQPRRLDDIPFVSYDKLDINLKFVVGDSEPVKLTFTNLTARAIANNHTDVAQPAVDVNRTNKGAVGKLTWDELPEDMLRSSLGDETLNPTAFWVGVVAHD